MFSLRLLSRARSPILCPWAIACASGSTVPEPAGPTPAAVAAVEADLQLIGKDTTWVVRGDGYALVARTKLEILVLTQALDEQARLFRRLFSAAPSRVVILARRPARPGIGPDTATLLPEPASDPVVEIVAPASGGRGAQRADARGASPGRGVAREPGDTPAPGARARAGGALEGGASVGRVMRVWLSARSTALLGGTGGGAPTAGDDPRVPDWAESALPALVEASAGYDLLALRLASEPDSLIPLPNLFTMRRPAGPGLVGLTFPPGAAPGRGRAERRSVADSVSTPPLAGAALFDAEARLVARFLMSREGYGFVGALTDLGIRGLSIAPLFETSRQLPHDLGEVDREWRRWLLGQADRVRPRANER